MRKVLGASVFNLWQMLSKDFVNLVIISCAIAIPVAWYFLHQWLRNILTGRKFPGGFSCLQAWEPWPLPCLLLVTRQSKRP